MPTPPLTAEVTTCKRNPNPAREVSKCRQADRGHSKVKTLFGGALVFIIIRRFLNFLSPAKMSGKYKIVMVRHGESEWNQKNLFCGWFDANLSDKGKSSSAVRRVV